MESMTLSSEVLFALNQIRHEKNCIESFTQDKSNDNIACVTLEVSGEKYFIMIHDEDAAEFANLLLKFNKKERARIIRKYRPCFCLNNLV